MLHYTLKITDIKQETTDAVTVAFKQPGLKKVKYLAGQYLTLILQINNRKYVRPYSFSSAPGVDSTLNITVKRVSGGVVSNHIVDCLKVGDIVEVMEPMGEFTLENSRINAQSHLVLWGVGSGITPLFSIVKHALANKIAENVTLVYGNRNHEHTIFSNQINALQKEYINTFSVWHFHTQPVISANYPTITEGRIDPDKVLSILKQEGNSDNTFHYICGPFGLKESVKAVLKSFAVADENIFSEDFSLITDQKIFEDILTRKVTINKAGKLYSVEVVKGKTILDAGLDAQLDLSYSCQTGSCHLCKAKLLSGELRSILNDDVDYNLQEDEYLLCCSLPLTDDIEIAVD